MDWLQRMNASLEYIEKNLDADIDSYQIAKISCCSPFHFQKVFSLMSGVPLSEYIRSRRLSQAAFDLQNSDMKVIDIALKYGYESPTAFNRAFQKMHGVAPNAARSVDVHLKAYPPISFQITIKGAVLMDYRIKQQKSIRVVGVRLQTTTVNEENLRRIPEFWSEVNQNGTLARLIEICKNEPESNNRLKGIMGICVGPKLLSVNEFDYYIAVATEQPPMEDMVEFIVPAANYAVFECTGPMPIALQKLTTRIYTEWLPNSGYELTEAPDIEVYSEGDNSAPGYKSEVWVPVVKKQC